MQKKRWNQEEAEDLTFGIQPNLNSWSKSEAIQGMA
jgi:hypothetical protein